MPLVCLVLARAAQFEKTALLGDVVLLLKFIKVNRNHYLNMQIKKINQNTKSSVFSYINYSTRQLYQTASQKARACGWAVMLATCRLLLVSDYRNYRVNSPYMKLLTTEFWGFVSFKVTGSVSVPFDSIIIKRRQASL